MFCTNCGTRLEDGVKFCFNCGKPVDSSFVSPANLENPINTAPDLLVEQEIMIESDAEPTIIIDSPRRIEAWGTDRPINAPTPIRSIPQYESAHTIDAEEYYEEAPSFNNAPPQDEYVPEYSIPKKKIGKIIIPVVGVAAFAGIAFFAGPKIIGAIGSGSMPVSFVSGKEFMLANKISGKNTKTLDIVKTKYEDRYSDYNYQANLMQFGKGGKYVFFLTKYDTNDGSGSLNFAQCSKLKQSADKNDKYITNIDSDVSKFKVLSTSEAVYQTSDRDLYYFDGKETHQIHKEVMDYWADEKGNIIYSLYDESNGTNTFYAVTTKDVSDDHKLLSNAEDCIVFDPDNLEKVLITKKGDDESHHTLYECGYSLDDAAKLAADVLQTHVYNKNVYYSQVVDTMSSYDLIEDSYAEKDQDIKEPDRDDFQIPYYSYTRISNTNQSYSEMYTSISNSSTWFDKTWSYGSMESSVDNSYYSDGVRSAVQAFIDKYEEKQDNQGYLLVTSEVMKDLQAINNADSGKGSNDWVKLCFTRKENGTTTDYEAYDAANEKYYEAADRIYARETLQNPDNDRPVLSLIEYSNGSLNTVQENVAAIMWSTNIQYNTYDMFSEKIAIEDYHGVGQLNELTAINYATQPIYILDTGNDQISQFGAETCESIEDISENRNGYLLATSDYIYYRDGKEIYSAPIEKNEIGAFNDEISDDAGSMVVVNDKLYYSNEPYASHNQEYGDLHCITKGKDEVIAKDINISEVYVFDDMLIYSTDGSINSYKGFTLAVNDGKGKEKEVGDDITKFVRVNDKHIYYLSGDDLYDYNGKDSERVIKDVDYFWTPDYVKHHLISLY